MPRYDPAKGYIAQGVPDDAVGTLDELKAHSLPTKVFRSCSEPSSDGSSLGCAQWYDCDMSYKGLPVTEGGGPRNHCWERIKDASNGGGIVRNCAPCFWGIKQLDIARENKEILMPIAAEGEDYETLTIIPDSAGGRDQFGFFKWDKTLVRARVPAFERLGQQAKLAQHELRASITKREQEKADHARAAKQLGVKRTDTPLDQRGKRSVAGTGEKV